MTPSQHWFMATCQQTFVFSSVVFSEGLLLLLLFLFILFFFLLLVFLVFLSCTGPVKHKRKEHANMANEKRAR